MAERTYDEMTKTCEEVIYMSPPSTDTGTNDKIDQVYELQDSIRDLVRQDMGDKIKEIEPDELYLNTISALDLIDDTATAFGIWQNELMAVESNHIDYIFTHGFMQCLQLQQDAVERLANILGIKLKRTKNLVRIRELRTLSSGHPMMQKKNKINTNTQISRSSMTPSGFELQLNDGKSLCGSREQVNLEELVRNQSIDLACYLELILNTITLKVENSDQGE